MDSWYINLSKVSKKTIQLLPEEWGWNHESSGRGSSTSDCYQQGIFKLIAICEYPEMEEQLAVTFATW